MKSLTLKQALAKQLGYEIYIGREARNISINHPVYHQFKMKLQRSKFNVSVATFHLLLSFLIKLEPKHVVHGITIAKAGDLKTLKYQLDLLYREL